MPLATLMVRRHNTDPTAHSSMTSPTIASPTITGTVAGGATYTAPGLSAPVVSGAVSGVPTAAPFAQVRALTFTQTAAGTDTASVVLPAGATVLDIIVNGIALWDAATSAVMIVGDGTDPDGFFTAVDLKATDLLAGESISFESAGGQAGAYIANSQVSPRYSATARTITGVVTSVGAGTTGRTRMIVLYSIQPAADVIAATWAA